MTSEVLLLAGRSGVGKSSVAFGCHDALRAAGVRHCVIDGDMLDMAYPTP
jgi:adenylylsulfate kinase-like enzyme